MSLEEKQQEIIDTFEMFDEWSDKYQYIIDTGKDLKTLEESKKTEENLIHGCQAQVWLDIQYIDGKMFFSADSDADIPKGIISLLIQVLNNETPEIVATADLHFIEDVSLQEFLSPTRSNGLLSMVKKMKMSALQSLAKQ